MKTNASRIWSCGIATLAFGLAGAHATTIGFNQDPAGTAWDRGDTGTGYAIFDQYATWQFSNIPAATGFGITSPIWSQTQAFVSGAQGGGLYIKQTGVPATGNNGTTNPGTDGEVLFGGGNPVNFVLGGTVSFTIRGIVLQVKRAGSTGTLADANGFAPSLSINGGTAIPYDAAAPPSTATGDTSSDSGSSAITSYYWNSSIAGLTQGAANTYAITASKGTTGVLGGLQRGIDGIELDLGNTSVVPEPATAGLLSCGLGLAGLMRRRRVVSSRRFSNSRPPHGNTKHPFSGTSDSR